MWEEVMGASLYISKDLRWIWVDFLHVDSHLYLYYLQSISKIFQVDYIILSRLVGPPACMGMGGNFESCRNAV